MTPIYLPLGDTIALVSMVANCLSVWITFLIFRNSKA